jgi:RNA polymerase sigma factor (sigma-70 family)
MASQQLSHVLQQLRRIYLLKEEANLNDGELLKRFFQQGDESTFEVLVQRYGPMVLGVCQRLLRNLHDAEDAFQTVFLVLVHKGRRLVGQEVIGNWLYRVAYNAALKARATAVQRRSKEPLAQVKPNEERDRVDRWNELRPLLDEELNKLSDKLREAIVLCDVLGRSRKEVAAQLGVPEGTLSWRLTRGRRRLAECLNRRGITLCGGAAMAVFSRNAVLAHVPAPLVNATVKAATAVAAGHAAAAGVISARVAALTEGVLKTMFVTKLKSIGAALLVLCIFGAGLGTL